MINLKDDPKVTVLMSVYNGSGHLSEAIESILNQTFTDFEFFIINDGSTDTSYQIIIDYARQDSRIRPIHQDNLGLTKSLNIGLGLAKGEYIARMDADDISFKHRLEWQVNFLDHNQEVGVLGSAVEMIDDQGNILYKFYPATKPLVVRWRLLFGNSLLHPTVMFRKNLVLESGGYPDDCVYAQDYWLWAHLAFRTLIAQAPEILVQYRLNTKGISFNLHEKQAETSIKVVQRNIKLFFRLDLPMDLAQALCDSYNVRIIPLKNGHLVLQAAGLLLKLREKYSERYVLSKEENREIKRDVVEKLLAVSRASAGYFPVPSLKVLGQVFIFEPRAIFKSSFWVTLSKAILGQKGINLIKRSARE